ncbi:hypothetical protein AVEN_265644-1 [Araneus ventricosus]|uniref:Uncharacterized protein n=1 Tax=Araneus ventricosus TaxID=182803 RepID=A0A4Y2GQL8_ARAVE|nr:hypothetical protein AVEN_265644-1 [Araneus ventricosus]
MALYNFVIHLFPLSRTGLEIITPTPPFSTRWRCKLFHPVAHSHFIVPRHHSYEDNCSHSVVKRLVSDFSVHPVYYYYPPIFPDLGERPKLVGPTEYCFRFLSVTFDNTLRPNLVPSRSGDSLGNLFPCLFPSMWKQYF